MLEENNPRKRECTPALSKIPAPPTREDLFHFMRICEGAMRHAERVCGEIQLTFDSIGFVTSFRADAVPVECISMSWIVKGGEGDGEGGRAPEERKAATWADVVRAGGSPDRRRGGAKPVETGYRLEAIRKERGMYGVITREPRRGEGRRERGPTDGEVVCEMHPSQYALASTLGGTLFL